MPAEPGLRPAVDSPPGICTRLARTCTMMDGSLRRAIRKLQPCYRTVKGYPIDSRRLGRQLNDSRSALRRADAAKAPISGYGAPRHRPPRAAHSVHCGCSVCGARLQARVHRRVPPARLRRPRQHIHRVTPIQARNQRRTKCDGLLSSSRPQVRRIRGSCSPVLAVPCRSVGGGAWMSSQHPEDAARRPKGVTRQWYHAIRLRPSPHLLYSWYLGTEEG